MASCVPWSEAPWIGVFVAAKRSAARQLLTRGEQQREVVEARVAPGAPGARLLVEDEQILLARAHHCQGVLPAVQPQADGVLVEGYRAIEVCHGQVHRSEAQRRGQLR